MKVFSLTIIKQLLFWICWFCFLRFVFYAYHIRHLAGTETTDVLLSFYHALPLDISVICVLFAWYIVLVLGYFVYPARFWERVFIVSTICLMIPIGLIYAGDIVLYDDWEVKIHYKIFIHLKRPAEPFKTATATHVFVFFSAFIINIVGGLYMYYRFFRPRLNVFRMSFIRRLSIGMLISILSLGIVSIGMRGGIQPIPISQSSVCFSSNSFINDVTVNTLWNLSHSVIENLKSFDSNPYIYMSNEEAEQIVDSLYQSR